MFTTISAKTEYGKYRRNHISHFMVSILNMHIHIYAANSVKCHVGNHFFTRWTNVPFISTVISLSDDSQQQAVDENKTHYYVTKIIILPKMSESIGETLLLLSVSYELVKIFENIKCLAMSPNSGTIDIGKVSVSYTHLTLPTIYSV